MNQTPGDTTASRELYWTRIIEEARQCPKGVKFYCGEKGISIHNYYVYFRRLRAAHPEWVDLENHPRKSRNGNGSNAPSEPEVEVVERAVRRKFSAAYKAKILSEVESVSPGKVAAILRREGLYSSHLHKWRAEESRRAHEARKRGPKTILWQRKLEGKERRLYAWKSGSLKPVTSSSFKKKLQRSWRSLWRRFQTTISGRDFRMC